MLHRMEMERNMVYLAQGRDDKRGMKPLNMKRLMYGC